VSTASISDLWGEIRLCKKKSHDNEKVEGSFADECALLIIPILRFAFFFLWGRFLFDDKHYGCGKKSESSQNGVLGKGRGEVKYKI